MIIKERHCYKCNELIPKSIPELSADQGHFRIYIVKRECNNGHVNLCEVK